MLSVAGCSNSRSNKAAGSPATEAYPRGTSQEDGRLRTTLGVYFSILLEMGHEPIADRCGHLAKILSPSELVVGSRQEIQPLWTFQRVMQSLALMEGDTFIPLTLDNQCGYGDSFSRPIGNLSEAVFVKVISQADSMRSSHNVRNHIRGLPPCQLL